MSRFSHLERTVTVGYAWENSLLTKSMPSRAFLNPLTANFFLALQQLLAEGMKNVRMIQRYPRI